MNKTVTSREAILAASQKLVMEKGLQAVNMRTVASVCGVAVGSVYNYFPLCICAKVLFRHTHRVHEEIL